MLRPVLQNRYMIREPISGRQALLILGFLTVAGCILYVGWALFWFLTDDAFIAFRYVGNSILGHGYVWNPPPFRPVEGYTSFGWVVLLDIVWRLTGVEPPASANVISLAFSMATLLVVTWIVLRLPLGERLQRFQPLWLGLVLLGVVTNRTFLMWSSSGLETAMFRFFLLAWLGCALLLPVQRSFWVATISALASALALTRPDGLLFVLFTAAGCVWAIVSAYLQSRPWKALCWASTPILVVPLHLLWRHETYGSWLPNTYYAKNIGAWPEIGVLYAVSFAVEYALWIWLIPFGLMILRSGRSAEVAAGVKRACSPVAAGVLAAVCLHIAYYTLIIGGDHFEYRIYSHVIPLVFVSFVWMLSLLTSRSSVVVCAFVLMIIGSSVIPWSTWIRTRELDVKPGDYQISVPLAPSWPRPVRWYASLFDRLQEEMIGRFVGLRHRKHLLWTARLQNYYPSRSVGLSLPSGGYPVFLERSVGVAGWSLARVNIIDFCGLNDYVIARNPISLDDLRVMAHDRSPPAGYVECFSPNVRIVGSEVYMMPREREFDAETIRGCEQQWASWVESLPAQPRRP